jgi:high-affinity iron transporter
LTEQDQNKDNGFHAMKKTIFLTLTLLSFFCFADEKQKASTNYIPNVAQGEKLYQIYCLGCHGAKGMSDATLGQTMKKKPAAIADPEILNRLSPEKVYEVVSRGISDQGMPSYKHLSEKERWDLAAFVFTLNCNGQKPSTDMRPSFSWTETRHQTDNQLVEILKKRGVPEKYIQKELSAARYLLE